jgi:hypothetical protein
MRCGTRVQFKRRGHFVSESSIIHCEFLDEMLKHRPFCEGIDKGIRYELMNGIDSIRRPTLANFGMLHILQTLLKSLHRRNRRYQHQIP